MRINITKVGLEYNEKYLYIKLFTQERWPTEIVLDYNQWQFAVDMIHGKFFPLRPHDVAVTDAFSTAEFYTNSICYNKSGEHRQVFEFPFHILRTAICTRQIEITEKMCQALKWIYWPIVVTDYAAGMYPVLKRFRYDLEPFVRRLQRIASNYSDGCDNIAVVHINRDGWYYGERTGWAEVKPSLYWYIRTYRPIARPELFPHSYYNFKWHGQWFQPEQAEKFIMNGGVIWHRSFKAGTAGHYSIHT